MTTRTARRSIIVESKNGVSPPPGAQSVASNGLSRPAPAPRGQERDAPWSFELNEQEKRMLAPRLAPLTEREREVVYAVCAGGQNPAIAERLFVALPTLRTHLMRVNQKLGLRSKSETMRFVLATLLESYRGRGRAQGGEGEPREPNSDPELHNSLTPENQRPVRDMERDGRQS